ncbi:unnamed protein product [Acanthoscelides obtectus]|uniref:PiggyBac transposable element-derived protein domain-containing protein n=1 Tax=Acanthoscelides obtectus TaxID=200917 RepID=A0A9P0LVC3_ACAOB|nr:unnamed protein product [Acanthoscelides obtectus]CAK1651264.1 PiggyBac transposable element-derived protein 4 [Acanthoscelides obtectus]
MMSGRKVYTDDELVAILEGNDDDGRSSGSSLEDSSEDDDEDYEALEGEVQTNGNEDDDVLEAGVQEAQGERSWSEPSCDLFNFDCNKTNAVSQHCLMLLEHTEKTPLDFYNLFLDDEIMDLIVSNTNLYATQELCKLIAREEITTGSRYNAWTDTNREEMKIFIAFLLWMGLDRKPEIRDYWKKHILYKNDVSCYISRNRFELLLGFIHFADNEMASPDNRLYKIEHLLRLLNNKFSIMFEPGEKITIDESMIPFRGRVKFRQYIPSKRHKYGLKVYKVCLLGGYTWHAKVYTGKASSGNLTVTTRTTMELMEPLLDQGRTLFTDSFYTSVELAEELLKRKTHLLGTLRVNRKHNPHGVTKAKLRRGDMKYLQHSEKKIIIGKWKDKRDVLFLTTKQVPHLVEIESRGGRRMQKPSTIVDYNSAKGYIDLSDQMAGYCSPLRKGLKWHRKLAFDLLTNTAVVNSHRLYTLVVRKKITIVRFREEIVTAILENLRTLDEQALLTPQQLHHKHRLTENRPKRGRCVVCYDKFQKQFDSKKATTLSKQVKTSCVSCTHKFMCIDCFFLTHNCVPSKR